MSLKVVLHTPEFIYQIYDWGSRETEPFSPEALKKSKCCYLLTPMASVLLVHAYNTFKRGVAVVEYKYNW